MAARNHVAEHKPDPNVFDLRTHFWDSQGNLDRKNLYTCYVRDGNSYYERPVNSGNLFTAGNQPAGRVEKTFGLKGQTATMRFDHEAVHREYVPQLTGDEALHHQLEQERTQRLAAEAELAAIKAEQAGQAPKHAPKAKASPLAETMGEPRLKGG